MLFDIPEEGHFAAGTKLGEFISLVEKYTGKKANIKLMLKQSGDVPFTNADVSKAARLLGYNSSRVTFVEGTQRTVAWFKEVYGENGERFSEVTAMLQFRDCYLVLMN